ncbi:enoyl-CoA hydratase/isomerase family protein [Sinimarinibacterium thermocellulolyticum]|uniref:Enoyl-CoA hydratase/isomerase family protein n=1 Tax=Sinimarinibacterium thermocellulolyticum TaxID=3170016 RepID=A0ABV2AEW6_9GAMM
MDALQIESPVAGVRLLRLHRPQACNALTTALQQAIDQALIEAEADQAVRAVVITGEGEQAFSAGYDVKELAGFDETRLLENYLQRQRLLLGLAKFPKPLIAAVNGLAHGGGAILATLCDLRIGGLNSEFRFTAAAYNGVNNTWQLPLLIGPAKALEFVMTARVVPAREALACGLLNAIAENGSVVDAALNVAAQIAMHPPAGVRWHKALIRERAGRSLEQAFDAENAVMSGPLRPGRAAQTFDAFLASRKR